MSESNQEGVPVSRTQQQSGGPRQDSGDLPLYEQAKRCPRCGQPGVLRHTANNHPRPGAKVETWACENELCITKGEGWIIQINPDGSIPNRQAGPKEFPVEKRAMDFGKAVVERTKHQLNIGEIESGSV